jgi:pseudaminic acid synthase
MLSLLDLNCETLFLENKNMKKQKTENKNNKTFIIAELSANHNNDFDLAVKTIEAMAKSGADAVKIQTYKPQSLTIDADNGHFAPLTEGLWKGYTPWKLYTEAAMPYEWQPKLKVVAENLGLVFFSSPFDLEAIDFLETINVPIYKIASFEITDIPLIEYAASKGKPMIISTGVAEEQDIVLAIGACRKTGNNEITLLKCTSQYPAPIEQANLLTIPDMKKQFGVEVGLSDHTMGSIVPVVAVSLGATIVEKHFILDRNLGGPDSAFSMEPHEFKEMVSQIRLVEQAMGKVTYEVSKKDKNQRRSLFVVEDIKAGEILTPQNIRSIRPGFGLQPKYLDVVIGKRAKKDLAKGKNLDWSDFENV